MLRFTPQQVLEDTSAPYGIIWHFHNDLVVPAQCYGNHKFLQISKHWKFNYGEGCVGRAYAKHEVVVVENTYHNGDRAFLRRGVAAECGILVVALVPLENGGILEVGYDHIPANMWMHSILAMWKKREDIERDSMLRIMRLRTPSPDCFIDYQIKPTFAASTIKQIDDGKKVDDGKEADECTKLDDSATNPPEPISELKSVGSALHPHGCTECFFYFFHTSGCTKGKDCGFCHEVHVRKKTRKNKQIQNRLEALHLQPQEEQSQRRSSAGSVEEVDQFVDKDRDHCPTTTSGGQKNHTEESTDALQQGASKPGVTLLIADRLPLSTSALERNDDSASCQTRAVLDLPTQEVLSLGSRGHPSSCGGACKYNKLRKGCKEGAGCSRCHLCVWSRQSERMLNAQRQLPNKGMCDGRLPDKLLSLHANFNDR